MCTPSLPTDAADAAALRRAARRCRRRRQRCRVHADNDAYSDATVCADATLIMRRRVQRAAAAAAYVRKMIAQRSTPAHVAPTARPANDDVRAAARARARRQCRARQIGVMRACRAARTRTLRQRRQRSNVRTVNVAPMRAARYPRRAFAAAKTMPHKHDRCRHGVRAAQLCARCKMRCNGHNSGRLRVRVRSAPIADCQDDLRARGTAPRARVRRQ